MKTLHGQLEYSNEFRSGTLGREMNVGITDVRSLHVENEKLMSPQSILINKIPLLNMNPVLNVT